MVTQSLYLSEGSLTKFNLDLHGVSFIVVISLIRRERKLNIISILNIHEIYFQKKKKKKSSLKAV